ncbi:MAG: hypothetical protein EA415_13270 [Sphaerobacteraceae bacterium]|nr:MAG: hypothetical protein EA415_13270 [Sphaerobacteraceae bacterium]
MDESLDGRTHFLMDVLSGVLREVCEKSPAALDGYDHVLRAIATWELLKHLERRWRRPKRTLEHHTFTADMIRRVVRSDVHAVDTQRTAISSYDPSRFGWVREDT